MGKEKSRETVIGLLFVCYMTGLFNLLLMPADFWLHVFDGILYGSWEEMRPFFSLGYFVQTPALIQWLSGNLSIGSWVKQMLIGNFLMFVPLGIFLPLVAKNLNRKNITVVSITIPLIVEFLQLTVGRSFDIDDLICNSIGIMVGYCIGSWIKKRQKIMNKQKTDLQIKCRSVFF